MPPAEPHDRAHDDERGHERDVADLADLRAAGVRAAGEPGEPGDPTLRRLGGVARSLQPDDFDLPAPPPDVWAGIAGRVDARDDVPEGSAAVTALRRPRGAGRPRWLVPAAAAAVVAVLLGVGAFVAAGRDSGPEVLASAVLEPLADAGAPGRARLVESGDGRQLDVTFEGGRPPADGGYLEVWLIDRQVDRMVSLGPVRADGTYDVPEGVDVAEFPVVDVSAEPTDGNPAHSGASILRGTLA